MSKRSMACDISQKVKDLVWHRDNKKCVICGRYVPRSCANAHFIKRSQGGLGILKNIVTLCPKCHYEEDFGQNTNFYEAIIESYLKGIYGPNWSKEDLIYRKWRN